MAGEISAIDSIGMGTYDPMMSMMGSYPGYGMTGMMGASPYMMGGIGGFNPAFMGQMMDYQTEMYKKMYKTQEELEKQKLEHATEMHALGQKADVMNMEAHERATFLKSMQDSDVELGVRGLYEAVRRGDQDDICMKYDELKLVLVRKYGDYFNSAQGQKNLEQQLNQKISELYAQYGTAWNGGSVTADLRRDINAYGESPFMNGFRRAFLGNQGHNEYYSEQTLNYLFGDRINDQGSKAKAQKAGAWTEHIAEATLGAPLAGAAAGLSATAIAKAILPSNLTGWMKYGKAAKIFAGLALVGDIFWQWSRA